DRRSLVLLQALERTVQMNVGSVNESQHVDPWFFLEFFHDREASMRPERRRRCNRAGERSHGGGSGRPECRWIPLAPGTLCFFGRRAFQCGAALTEKAECTLTSGVPIEGSRRANHPLTPRSPTGPRASARTACRRRLPGCPAPGCPGR